MPIMRQSPPKFAVHTIYVAPSDYVFKDRFGAAISEQTLMQNVEQSVLEVRQWYYDTTGGLTFDVVPATLWRSSKSTTQIYNQYGDYTEFFVATYEEMVLRGAAVAAPTRLPNMYCPLWMNGAGNSFPGTSFGNPWFPWGGVMGMGWNGMIFGGQMPAVNSAITTVANAASSTATTLTLASGGGKVLAVAARHHVHSSRVQSFTGTGSSATTIVCTDLGWLGGVPTPTPSAPIDGVVWPYGKDVSVSTAESIKIVGADLNTKTVTVLRAQNGTLAVSIAGGGENDLGSHIARRATAARIWTPPAQPEAPGCEVVRIDAINGDTITVARGQVDAWFYPSPPAARAILAGDSIVSVDDIDGFFYQKKSSAQGGFAHELGHNMGMKQYNPVDGASYLRIKRDSAGVPISNPDGSFQTEVVNVLAESAGRLSVDTVPGQGFWDHLPHTPYNPATPGISGPFVMINYWDFPYGNVAAPAAGFTDVELTQIQKSPYLHTQNRPTAPVTVTADTFKSAAGAGLYATPANAASANPTPPPSSGSTGYRVQPVLWWPSGVESDQAFWDSNVVPGTYTLPVSKTAAVAQYNAGMLRIQQWFFDRTGGWTFDVEPVLLFLSDKTRAQLEANSAYNGVGGILRAMQDVAVVAQGAVDLDDVKILNLLAMYSDAPFDVISNPLHDRTTPIGPPTGLTTSAQPADPPFISGIFGATALSASFGVGANTEKGLMIAAHELGHALGYDAAAKAMLPHDDVTFRNLMVSGFSWTGLDSTVLTQAQIDLFKLSPYMRRWSARP